MGPYHCKGNKCEKEKKWRRDGKQDKKRLFLTMKKAQYHNSRNASGFQKGPENFFTIVSKRNIILLIF